MPQAPAPNAVLCVGRLYADLIFTGLSGFPNLGREEYARRAEVMPGGGAFITASVLAGLGRRACLSTRIPGHTLNLSLLPNLLSSGIDVSGVERGEPDEPQVTVAIVDGSERAFLTRRVGPSVPQSFYALIEREDIVHVHIAEMATLADAPDIVGAARRAGKSVSLDCAWDEDILSRRDLLGLLHGVDLFLPNTGEAEAILGTPRLTPEALRPLRDVVSNLAIKRGELGGWLFRGDEEWSVAAAVTEVVDTTGAGDSFNAGFLNAWLGGQAPETCLLQAVAAGSLAVGVAGGANVRPSGALVEEGAARLSITGIATDLRATV